MPAMAIKGSMAFFTLMASLCVACEGTESAFEVDEACTADAAACSPGGSAMIQRKHTDKPVGKHVQNQTKNGAGSIEEEDDHFRLLASLLTQGWQPTIGLLAELDERGYKSVVGKKSNKEMALFVLRLVRSMNMRVIDSESNPLSSNTSANHPFFSFVSWYSGVKQSQSFANLQKELTSLSKSVCSWVQLERSVPKKTVPMSGLSMKEEPGRMAQLSEEGYRTVAARSDTPQMIKFVRRVMEDMKMTLIDEGGLKGFVPYFDCTHGAKTYDDLRKELKSAASESVWIKWKKTG